MIRVREDVVIELCVHRETEKAFRVEPADVDDVDPFWVAKKLVTQGPYLRQQGRFPVYCFDVPEWVLREQGLVD